MFAAPYVISGMNRTAWLRLPNAASRLFVNLVLDLTVDWAHPHWSVRPLSISHLLHLWPGPRPSGTDEIRTRQPQDRDRALRGAIETELLWRLKQQLPDVTPTGAALATHEHEPTVQSAGNCQQCAAFLEAGSSVPDLRPALFDALDSNSSAVVLCVVPSLVSEMLAMGWHRISIHRVPKRYMRLDQEGKQSPKPFVEGLMEFLYPTPDSGQPDEEPVAFVRRVLYDRPSRFSFPAIGAIDEVSLVQTPGDVFLHHKGVPDSPNKLFPATEELNAASEKWAAYIRLALPRNPVSLANAFKISSDGSVQGIRRPEHRQFWAVYDSGQNVSKLLSVRSLLGKDDRERLDACVSWAGLAVALWNEAPTRSPALL